MADAVVVAHGRARERADVQDQIALVDGSRPQLEPCTVKTATAIDWLRHRAAATVRSSSTANAPAVEQRLFARDAGGERQRHAVAEGVDEGFLLARRLLVPVGDEPLRRHPKVAREPGLAPAPTRGCGR